jgi:hypothetical protein
MGLMKRAFLFYGEKKLEGFWNFFDSFRESFEMFRKVFIKKNLKALKKLR